MSRQSMSYFSYPAKSPSIYGGSAKYGGPNHRFIPIYYFLLLINPMISGLISYFFFSPGCW